MGLNRSQSNRKHVQTNIFLAEEMRNLWENRLRKGPKEGLKIKVYMPSGLF